MDRTELADARSDLLIPKHANSVYERCNLFEQLDPFRTKAILKRHETSGIAPRLPQAVNVTGAYGIRDLHEHDWHRMRHPAQVSHSSAAYGEYDVRGHCGQLGCMFATDLHVTCSPAAFELDVATLDPAEHP